MNWKEKRELRETQMKALELERKNLAKIGWKSMGKIERDQLYKKINFDWDNMQKFIRDRIPSKDEYVAFEIENYCVKKIKKTQNKWVFKKSKNLLRIDFSRWILFFN